MIVIDEEFAAVLLAVERLLLRARLEGIKQSLPPKECEALK